MNKFDFDCSQFIAVRTLNQINRLEHSPVEGLYLKRLVDVSKLDYLKQVVEVPQNFQVWEIVDDEFQGEFEEWEDVNSAPPKLESLMGLIDEIAGSSHEDFACVLVQSATLAVERIWRCHCLKSEFRRKLFAKSLFSIEEDSSAEVSVFWINSSGK